MPRFLLPHCDHQLRPQGNVKLRHVAPIQTLISALADTAKTLDRVAILREASFGWRRDGSSGYSTTLRHEGFCCCLIPARPDSSPATSSRSFRHNSHCTIPKCCLSCPQPRRVTRFRWSESRLSATRRNSRPASGRVRTGVNLRCFRSLEFRWTSLGASVWRAGRIPSVAAKSSRHR